MAVPAFALGPRQIAVNFRTEQIEDGPVLIGLSGVVLINRFRHVLPPGSVMPH
jgi:hypothetical protein